MKNILYVGVDVDDKNFTGATFSEETNEQIAFKTRPNAASLLKKLKEFQNKGYELSIFTINYYPQDSKLNSFAMDSEARE